MRVVPRFTIHLHKKDLEVLFRINKFFNGVGSITQSGTSVYYTVESMKCLELVIIPHFDNTRGTLALPRF